MKTVAVMAWREIVEHRVFLLAALAALAVTLVVPMVPAFLGWSATDVREVLMWSMALGFTWLSAIFLGASMVTGAVAGQRFGFFLARPASAAAIWFGKLLGVLALVWVGEVLILVPATMVASGNEIGLDETIVAGLVFGIPLVLVLVAHAVATIWRGGTALAAADVVGVAVLTAAAWLSIRPLLQAGADEATTVVGLLLCGGLAVSVMAAGAFQIALGRCDGRRQHRIFSSVAWTILLSACAGSAAFSAWLLHPSVEDLARADEIFVQPGGSWIGVAGPARGRVDVEGAFALDLEGGSSLRLGLGTAWDGRPAPVFSADGRVAAWAVRDGNEWSIRSADLEAPAAGGLDSPIIARSRLRLVVSPVGRRVAMIEENTLVVTDLASGDLVGSARLPSPSMAATPYFLAEDRVRLLLLTAESGHDGGLTLQSLEFDCQNRTLATTGSLHGPWSSFSATFDGTRDRLLLRLQDEHRSESYRYVDARSLEPVSWSAERELGRGTEMMADGRLVRFTEDEEGCRVERLTPDGRIDGSARLKWCPKRFVIGFQPSSSTVTVAASRTDWGDEEHRWQWWFDDWALLLADLDSGRLSEIAAETVPPRWWYRYGRVATPLPAGCAAARVFLGEGGSLWRWRPQSGDMEPLVPRQS